MIIKTAAPQSTQIIQEERLAHSGVLLPPFDFERLLSLYYANSYHRLCINIKTRLLSCLESSELAPHLVGLTPTRFMRKVALSLELFGTAFIEVASKGAYRALYPLPTLEGRIKEGGKGIVQAKGLRIIPLEGAYIAYDSPRSRFYGEPDYIAALNAILVNQGIDLYNATFFENGAVPRLAVVFEGGEVSEEQLASFQRFFGSSFKGSGSAHKTLILSTPPNLGEGSAPKVRFERLSEGEDLSFEKLKNLNRDEIIAAHGVPPRLAGVMHSGSLGGGGELLGQLHAFNEIHIKPKIELLEEFFATTLGVKVVLKPLDITDFKDDASVIPSLVQAGILTPLEAKNILGWSKNI